MKELAHTEVLVQHLPGRDTVKNCRSQAICWHRSLLLRLRLLFSWQQCWIQKLSLSHLVFYLEKLRNIYNTLYLQQDTQKSKFNVIFPTWRGEMGESPHGSSCLPKALPPCTEWNARCLPSKHFQVLLVILPPEDFSDFTIIGFRTFRPCQKQYRKKKNKTV